MRRVYHGRLTRTLVVNIVEAGSFRSPSDFSCARKNLYLLSQAVLIIRYGVVANIIASHAIARGSIPRVGILLEYSQARLRKSVSKAAMHVVVYFALTVWCLLFDFFIALTDVDV